MADKITITIGSNVQHKSKYGGVTIKSEILEVTLDPVALASKTAEAGAEAVRSGIRGITARTRDRKRPLFNNTGELARGIAVRAAGDASEVVAPPDRLEDDALAERLAELVPAIADPLRDPVVQRAIEDGASMIVTVRK